MDTTTHTSLAQRSQHRIHFDHEDMDYYLAWLMGREMYDGSEAGECLQTVARIAHGDAAGWGAEWRRLAAQVEAQADDALKRGDTDAARRAYLRACTYYRAPLFIMRRQDAQFDGDHRQMQACFRRAAALFDPPVEPIQVPFEGHMLDGYVWKADASGEPRPTLIVFGGIETFAEDCYFMIGTAGAERGYHVMTVDLPGQGVNPDTGLYFGARMERPVAAVLDYALRCAEVDGTRLAIYGFSWGGHIVFKGAQHDPRIRAVIANPPMPNVIRSVLAQQQGTDRSDPLARIVFDQIVWRMGLKISFDPRAIAQRFGKAYDYFVHGKADPRRIACPALLLAGEGEAAVTLKIARECYEQLAHPGKKLVIFTREQGGEAHCQVDNLALPNGVIFDWLDRVLA